MLSIIVIDSPEVTFKAARAVFAHLVEGVCNVPTSELAV
jgi:hypothetical protein